MEKKARVIALYLPQFHPIPENDEWWGKGFTEWTNVAKAKPLFKGHVQPKVPTELGFYDLRLEESRIAQAELAKEAGVEAFCYWHYWFGNGKRLLERPFNEVLASGKPDFPFCLGWANHTWTSKTWDKGANKNVPTILVEQTYPGEEDYTAHFYAVLPAFKDPRYVTVDGKPFFLIFDPLGFKDVTNFMKCWRKLAIENGLKGVHFVGIGHSLMYRAKEKGHYSLVYADDVSKNYKQILDLGFDAVNSMGHNRARFLAQGAIKSYFKMFLKKVLKINRPDLLDLDVINRNLYCEEDKWENVYPTIMPNFDRTPRTNNDSIMVNSTPEVFEKNIEDCLSYVKDKEDEHKIIILKSWNEWGEGNYVEPDLQYGRGYINALKNKLFDNN